MSIQELAINILWVIGTLWVVSLVVYLLYQYFWGKNNNWKDRGADYK